MTNRSVTDYFMCLWGRDLCLLNSNDGMRVTGDNLLLRAQKWLLFNSFTNPSQLGSVSVVLATNIFLFTL